MSQPENEFLSAKEWAAKEFWPKQPRCSGYEGGCDGDLPGEEHIAACPMHGKLPINFAEFAEAYAEYRLASRAPATTPRPGMMSAQEHVEKCCACNHGRSPCSEYRRLRDAEDSTLAGVERTDGQARSILDGVRIEQQTDTQKVAQAAVPGGKEPPALNINELDEKFPVRPEHKDMNEVLVGCANLLDTIKSEWGEAWSEWDQSVRNGITRVLLNTPPATHPLQDKPPAAPEVEALAKHWLFAMHCNHEEETDTATCACGWNSNPHSSVGLAAEAWAAHALWAAQDKPTP